MYNVQLLIRRAFDEQGVEEYDIFFGVFTPVELLLFGFCRRCIGYFAKSIIQQETCGSDIATSGFTDDGQGNLIYERQPGLIAFKICATGFVVEEPEKY